MAYKLSLNKKGKNGVWRKKVSKITWETWILTQIYSPVLTTEKYPSLDGIKWRYYLEDNPIHPDTKIKPDWTTAVITCTEAKQLFVLPDSLCYPNAILLFSDLVSISNVIRPGQKH